MSNKPVDTKKKKKNAFIYIALLNKLCLYCGTNGRLGRPMRMTNLTRSCPLRNFSSLPSLLPPQKPQARMELGWLQMTPYACLTGEKDLCHRTEHWRRRISKLEWGQLQTTVTFLEFAYLLLVSPCALQYIDLPTGFFTISPREKRENERKRRGGKSSYWDNIKSPRVWWQLKLNFKSNKNAVQRAHAAKNNNK